MVKITNTPIKNAWGDGHVQELTLDNGEKYTITNTPIKNAWGDGHVKSITKQQSSKHYNTWNDVLAEFIGLIIIAGIWFLLFYIFCL